MNLVAGAGISGLSFSHFFGKNCTNLDCGQGRIKTFSDKPPIDMGAQFFSKKDLSIYRLIKDLNMQSEIKQTNFNKLFLEKNGLFIEINSTKEELLNKDAQNINLFKNKLKKIDNFLINNFEELQHKPFYEWYSEEYGGESIWIIDGILKSITFSNSKELNSLYGLIACQSFFTKTFTVKNGLEQVLKKLRQDKTIVKSKLEYIELQNKSFKVKFENNNPIPCKKLASAIPSNYLSQIISDKELAKYLSKIPYSGCKVILIKTQDNLTNNFPGLITPERKYISAILKNKSYYTILAPYKSFCTTDEQIFDELNLNTTKELILSTNWDYGLPTCTTKLHLIQEKINEITDQYDNFAICGDFMGLPSLDACVESAKKAAEKLNKN